MPRGTAAIHPRMVGLPIREKRRQWQQRGGCMPRLLRSSCSSNLEWGSQVQKRGLQCRQVLWLPVVREMDIPSPLAMAGVKQVRVWLLQHHRRQQLLCTPWHHQWLRQPAAGAAATETAGAAGRMMHAVSLSTVVLLRQEHLSNNLATRLARLLQTRAQSVWSSTARRLQSCCSSHSHSPS